MQVYVLLIIVAAFIFIIILGLVISLSVSNKRIHVEPTKLNGDKVFLSFAGGDSIHKENQKLQEVNNKIHGLSFKNCHYLTEEDLNLFTEYKGVDVRLRNTKRGFGYWIWKSFLLHEMMKIYPDGTILVYLDAGAHLKKEVEPLYSLFTNGITRLFVENTHDNTSYTKCEPIHGILGKDMIDKFYKSKQLDASFICLVNNETNRQFVSSWFDLCKKYSYISDFNSIGCQELSTFIEHRHDQSLLSLLVFQDSLQNETNTKIITRAQKDTFINHHNRRVL